MLEGVPGHLIVVRRVPAAAAAGKRGHRGLAGQAHCAGVAARVLQIGVRGQAGHGGQVAAVPELHKGAPYHVAVLSADLHLLQVLEARRKKKII